MKIIRMCIPLFLITTIFSQEKHAIVVGVSNYNPQYSSILPACVNDANSMALILNKMGFEVQKLLDANQTQIHEAIWKISDLNLSKDDVVLFYFSGHGAVNNGKHYLMPVDIATNSSREYKFKAVSTNWAQERLEKSGASTRIMILDACRHAFSRFGRKANQESGIDFDPLDVGAEGTFIAYSSAPNQISYEDPSIGHGVYTYYLLEEMIKPNQTIEAVFKNVRSSVIDHEATPLQVPWESSSLIGDFTFTSKFISNDEDMIAQNAQKKWAPIKEECLSGDCENGFGVKRLLDGSIYEGNFKKGQFHGVENYIYYLNSDDEFDGSRPYFIGDFIKGKLDGKGEIVLPEYANFIAALKIEDKINLESIYDSALSHTGFGIFYFIDRRVIEGNLKNGFWHGLPNIYLDYDAETFQPKEDELFFMSGKLNFLENGEFDCSKGCLEGDCINGEGKKVYDDCSVYLGNFKNGQHHGEGRYFDALAETLIFGEWNFGSIDNAYVAFESGDVYQGEVDYHGSFDITLQGEGTYTYMSGDSYSGNFRDDFFHGQFQISCFLQEWFEDVNENGILDENEIYYDFNDNNILDEEEYEYKETGEFEDGEPITEGYCH